MSYVEAKKSVEGDRFHTGRGGLRQTLPELHELPAHALGAPLGLQEEERRTRPGLAAGPRGDGNAWDGWLISSTSRLMLPDGDAER